MKEAYYLLVKGNNNIRWTVPVEIEPDLRKNVYDDGVYLFPREDKVPHTDTMKLYNINVDGDNMKWVLSTFLEPEVAQEMRNAGVNLEEVVEEVKVEKVVEEVKAEEVVEEKLEEVVIEEVVVPNKKRKSKEKAEG